MPLPIIGDTFRVTFNFTGDGPSTHNVLHFSAPSLNEQELGLALDGEATVALWAPLSSTYSLESYTVLALDGTSAGTTVPASAGNNGGATGGAIPAAAAIMSLGTGLRGPAHRGRFFMGPVGESAQAGGRMLSGEASDWQDAWTAYAEALAGLAEPAFWVVASYTLAEAHGVTSIVARTKLGTQRRRQDAVS